MWRLHRTKQKMYNSIMKNRMRYTKTVIAQDTGFYDQSHFIRTFRAATGLTPAVYRKRNRQ